MTFFHSLCVFLFCFVFFFASLSSSSLRRKISRFPLSFRRLSKRERPTIRKNIRREGKKRYRSIDDYSFFVVRFSFLWVMTMKREDDDFMSKTTTTMMMCCFWWEQESLSNLLLRQTLIKIKQKTREQEDHQREPKTRFLMMMMMMCFCLLLLLLYASFSFSLCAEMDKMMIFVFVKKNCFSVVNFSVIRLLKKVIFWSETTRNCLCWRERLFFFFFFFCCLIRVIICFTLIYYY